MHVHHDLFHPAVATWFQRAFGAPTAPQAEGWPAIKSGRHTLIAAPTGSGKTLAAFLGAIDDLVRRGVAGELRDEVHVVYVSPLKALGNDIEKNLREPLAGIASVLREMGLPEVEIRAAVRTGDTLQKDRAAATKKPPHIFVTTPESLFILLTSEGGRRMLKSTRAVIVDEIHALVRDKRGSHLALSLERLEALAGEPLVRIGLSATQKPIEEVARFLVGSANVARDGTPACTIVDAGHRRAMDLAIELPRSPLETVMAAEVWDEIYDRLAELIEQHRTTLVFVNTRRLAERVTRHLSDRLGKEHVTSHHGSLARDQRLEAERRLKSGELRALVATASLELGIDVGDVDLVCQVGSTRSIATFLQRVGRSGHHLRGTPRGRIFPLSREELVETAAMFDAIRRGELDRVVIPEAPLDILAQQIVAASAPEDWEIERLYALVKRAWPYRALAREKLDDVIAMLADGFSTARGRRGAWIHLDAVNGRIRGRRGARLASITSGGAIPDTADYEVLLEPVGMRIGTLNEDFAIESMPGDIFQLGNTSYRILRIEPGKVRVDDAKGAPPTIPFWLGEAPGRTDELSAAVSRMRARIDALLAEDEGIEGAVTWLVGDVGLSEPAARQIADHLAIGRNALGAIPTQDTLVLERFFDEAGGMHVVIHAPFGTRLNRAWGLALRKRFCRSFNVELQAAATDDSIVISLGPTHSFPLEDVFSFLRSNNARDVLAQAVLDAPLFETRWRWNAGRALAVLRFRGGRKVAPQIQRMQADDLLAVTFPDQVACLENVAGDREIPDHPLVAQTLRDCFEEAMDADGLVRMLADLEQGKKRLLARDLAEPSPFAAEVLSARPYSYLDDAPLEERRTLAVASRRWLDPATASDLGALDSDAIARVREESWPDPRDADELHDALVVLGGLTEQEGRAGEWQALFDALAEARRAAVLEAGGTRMWVAAERLGEWRAVHPEAAWSPAIAPIASRRAAPATRDDALRELVRSRLEGVAVTTAAELASALGVPEGDADAALAALEGEGFVLRGKFRPGAASVEWCERRLLARIHRYTLSRLRREIEPVTASDYVRFLAGWQHAAEDGRAEGTEGLAGVLEQLEGFEAAAAAWEADVLPLRVAEYEPAWLDALCLAGRVAWARRTPAAARAQRSAGPVRATPIAIVTRHRLASWLGTAASVEDGEELALTPDAEKILRELEARGASFFDDLVRGSGVLKTRVEEALGELVAQGLVTSDGFVGLRALLVPSNKRRPLAGGRRRGHTALFGMESAGRWSTLPRATEADVDVEAIARTLLLRWGVVFRRVIEREGTLPPWRDLLQVYRRLEARGEIRGGRFVAGFSGEQYALPEAIGSLRKVRREEKSGQLVSVSGADPLNLVGIVTPGRRLPAIASNRVLWRDGVPIAVREGGEVRFMEDAGELRWQLEGALVKRAVPPQVRAYLGNAG